MVTPRHRVITRLAFAGLAAGALVMLAAWLRWGLAVATRPLVSRRLNDTTRADFRGDTARRVRTISAVTPSRLPPTRAPAHTAVSSPPLHAMERGLGGEDVLSRAFAWLALLLCAASAYLLMPKSPLALPEIGIAAMLLGGIALGAPLRLAPQIAPLPSLSDHAPVAARPRWRIAALGVLGLALLAEMSGNLLGTGLPDTVSHHTQFALLCLSLALLTWGLGGRLSLSAAVRARHVVPLLNEALILFAITALALFLRAWQLGEAVHFFVDEVNFATGVMDFRTARNIPLLAPFSSVTAFPWLFPYMQASAVGIFGRNLVGLRAVSAIMGTLTIPALYLLARALFDRKTALLAALLLAVFPPHMHFSRLGINNIADPLFGTLALAFLARGLRYNHRMDYAIAGVSLGLTQYFYEGGRLLYPALVILWLTGIMLMRRRKQSHLAHNPSAPQIDALSSPPPHCMERGSGGGDTTRNLLTCFLAALIVAAPIYYSLLGTQMPAASRLKDVSLPGEFWHNMFDDANARLAYLDHLDDAFAIYVHQPESSLFYGGEQPLLLAYLVPALLLGVFYVLSRLRSPGALLLALWLLLTSLGSTLLVESAHSSRFVVVFPALALQVAVGIRYTVPLLGLRRRLPNALVAVLVATFAVGQVAYYFGPHLESFRQQFWYSRDSNDGQDAAFRAATFPRSTDIHIITREPYLLFNDDAIIMNFLADGLQFDNHLSRDITPQTFDQLPLYVDHAFFIEPEDLSTLLILRQRFVLEGPQFSPYNIPISRQFILYYAPQWMQPR